MPEMRDALSMGDQKTPLKKYIAIGIVVCYVISFTLNTIIDLFVRGNHYTVSSIGSIFAGSCIAGHFFFKDHGRASSIAENARYSWCFLLWGILIPLVLLLAGFFAYFYYAGGDSVLFPIVVFIDGLRKATLEALFFIALVCLVFVALTAFYYVAIRWSFSWYTKLQWKQQMVEEARRLNANCSHSNKLSE